MSTTQTAAPVSPAAGPASAYRQVAATGVSTAFGTFGELLQGVLPEEDGNFLVTLPVARWSMARFEVDTDRPDLEVWPPHKKKALKLTSMILEDEGRPAGGLLRIDSTLPEGKGLASSSADLVATARAVANALAVPMPPRRIESYLARIEPTDGVLYPAIVAFHHRSVRLRASLGSLPSMAVVGVDEGGAVDTVAFNAIPKPFTEADKQEYARLLDRVTRAVAARDLAEAGRVATASARMNQVLRRKWSLEPMIAICEEVGGLGVVVGHSGTTLGILMDTGAPDCPARLAAAAQLCQELAGNVTVYQTLSFH
ncbi:MULTISPECIES: kinase [unclassified Streptomyces]|uniref:GHMP family kinase ATP-binding protein n=1 Tax=unclassified Streptomyces TaxID=2593676 RepID=UPI001BEC1516|nr:MULTISPECIES: kinase [unclassified Streptomyces]MBT2405510.1 kinase [Streptomyces sp. ISL-21]MBT2454428.1 kinase [Streptomyces sp. ISL-86]MBT2607811.1 kinase [Streptomyces sp. ISL-87]